MKWWDKLLIITVLTGAVIFVVEHKKRQGFACASCVCTLPAADEASAPAPIAPAAKQVPAAAPIAPAAEQIPVAAPAKLAAKQDKPLPKLLDLGAGKCIPCKMMMPILDEMKETYAGQLEVEFIDVWKNQNAGTQYGIRMIPTQIFFDAQGKELFRHEGFFAKEDILAKWAEFGIKLETDK